MGYPLTLALRYLRSKKRNMISISTALAVLGVTLGVAALAIVMSVTGGFQEQFRDKVLGVNAHVLVLKYSLDFREYRKVLEVVNATPGVVSAAPFAISPMMLTHGSHTAPGVLLKGADPAKLPPAPESEWVLDLPKHITRGSLELLRRPNAKPGEANPSLLRPYDSTDLEGELTIPATPEDVPDAGARKVPPPPPSSTAPSAVRDAGAAPVGALDAGAAKPRIVGDITPDGGYGSELPKIDILPPEIDPDPCKSPAQIAKMPGIVMGETLAEQLGVNIGDCVDVTSPMIGISYTGRSPIRKSFRLIATFKAGFDQYDSKLVYTDLYEAQAFYEYGDSVTGIEIRVDDIDRAGDIAQEIQARLHDSVYHTMDWQDLNHGLFTALLIQQIIMSFVLALIILVAAFTVIATLIMVVLDKKKEISLLKALGAKDSAVLRVFLYQGGIIGVVGTTLGLIIGYGCCRLLLAHGMKLDPKVYFISELPVSMHPQEFITTGIIAIAICLIGTIFPARYAAKLRPSDGLRAD